MTGSRSFRDRAAAGGKERLFRLTALAVEHRTSVLVLFVLIALVGTTSYRSIPKESSPEIVIPMISVSTIYPGVSPKDMETLVTRVLEDELNRIPEIVDLTSTSVEGYSNVLAEFDTDMDMEEALQKVREKVDLARPELPEDAEEPVLSEFNFSEWPIMQVNVSGQYGLVRLKEVAEDLQDRLEQIPSILDVRLSGGLEREVRVEVDLTRLQHYGIAYDDLVDVIRDENVTIPGGSIDVGAQKYLLRVAGEFENTRVIEDVVVTTRNGRPIYVRDLASVDFGFKERDSYARLDGHPVVTLDIVKRSGENIIETADAVRATVARAQPTFPPTTVVKITSDQSEDIHEMVSSLENNIISGLVLVLAVLLFFLGVRNAGFVAVSIPMSMLLSFVIMKSLGMTMNMVVLFSLILALGMLVDNAIVVVENIYRHVEKEGYDNFSAAVRATSEVAMPIIGSTATTVAAFTPLMFWPGIVGEFMKFLPTTLIITLSSSLFVALVIVPVLCALFMKIDGTPTRPMTRPARWLAAGLTAFALLIVGVSNPLTAVLLAATGAGLVALNRFALARSADWFQHRALPRIIARYERDLRWALVHRKTVVGGAVAVLVGSFIAYGTFGSGVEFFPEDIPPTQVYARIDVPSGTNATFTNQLALSVEQELGSISGMKDAVSVVATAGSSTGGDLFSSGAEGNVGVSFADYKLRSTNTFETLQDMQTRIGADLAGARIKVEKLQDGPPTGKPVTLEIVGEESERLKQLGDRAIEVLKVSPVYAKLEGLESDMARGRPELVVDVDREKAAIYGLSTWKVGSMVRTAIQGREAAKYRTGNDEYDIVVRLAEPFRSDLNALQDLTVSNEDGDQIPLQSVASWRVEEGFGSIQRKNLDRVVTVSSDVRTGENSNAVLAEVKQALARFDRELPPGYSMRFAGQQADQQEAQEFLSGAFVIALFMIALILVSQFNSVVKPLIIMTSVIMSTAGVLLGLIVFRMPFGIIMTGVGVISLAGVVVNNAIVLIDYVDLLRTRDGYDRTAALIRAGSTRFRPVVLTAVTTVLGLVPLAIGFNFDFFGLYRSLSPDIYWGGEQAAWWGPMAIAVIAGLSFATVLTLVLVPVMYIIADDLALWFRRTFIDEEPLVAPVDVAAREEAQLEPAGAG